MQRDVETRGEFVEEVDCGVTTLALKLADVGAIHFRIRRQSLL
ncbi:MAG TPA: hypothetical protein VIM56_10490 [Rhizomicrobium sp.]